MADAGENWVGSSVVGVDILGLVTSGMYGDPLAVYREYIQNAVDAIYNDWNGETGKIEITMSRDERRVTIRDNGPGLPVSEVRKALIPIASSQKRREARKGV